MVVFIPFYPNGKDSRTFCILRAYLTAVSTTLLTSSFLLQALSRLFHTVFPMNRRCLLTWKFHYFLIAVQWMMGFLTPITILINHENIIYRTEMITICSNRFFHVNNIWFLFLFGINVAVSIHFSQIQDAMYIASTVTQSFSNITCIQCTCIALTASAIGWNCIRYNDTCQLIQNYSISDVGLQVRNNTSFYFQQLPFESPSPATTPLTTTTATTTSISCTATGVGNIDRLTSSSNVSWTQYSYNFTAYETATTISFGVNGNTQNCIFLDDISVIDIANPSVELLTNPGFENSTTTLTGWNAWYASTCGGSSAGHIVSDSDCRFSSNCYRGQCSSSGTDYLIQSFATTLNHVYTISFWQRSVRFSSGGASLYLYIDIF
ncbi:unnamed protein product [Adineta steineri]|uniref:Ig-like domain-containing protein n=1 Tax=Adineta steineri TaxID=433720 RepID=A0A813XIR6_9BILA|nr:unnamed protein product [Adineta steineri]